MTCSFDVLLRIFIFQYERQKKFEREQKKKQEALTLEETKEQIANLEHKLNQYKTEKHELFHTLKKVLHDDETRRRAKEAPHPNIYMQPAVRPQGGIYMKPHPQLLITSQQPPQQTVKRQRSPSPPRSGIPAAYFRNPVGPSGSKYPVTTAYSAPSAHSAHYTSYNGSAVGSIVSVGNNHLEHEEAARAKHIYLAPAAQQARFAERERGGHPARSLAPPPAAHSSVTPVYRSGTSGSIMTGYPRYNLPSGSAAITTAGAIAGSPRLTHSQANGTGPPQRYYTSRE